MAYPMTSFSPNMERSSGTELVSEREHPSSYTEAAADAVLGANATDIYKYAAFARNDCMTLQDRSV